MTSHKTKLKIVLVQLPLPEFKLNKQWGNVPLACGYLKAMCHKRGLLEDADIEILDAQNSNLSGDARLAEALCAKAPDVLGFSLYCWNSMRSLSIAEKVKKRLPHLKVIVGGPEVTEDSKYILDNPVVDIGCLGEGEFAFSEYIEHILGQKQDCANIQGIFYREGRDPVFTSPRSSLKDISEIPSPYLLGLINPQDYGVMCIETQRGCRFRCAYCGEGIRPLRFFQIETIEKELELAASPGVKRIIFMESAFNLSPNFARICRSIKRINKGNLALGAAAYAEYLTEESASMLQECGSWALDIGLQSADPVVLQNIGRRLDREKFIRGLAVLRKKNIPFSINLMAGLPGQTVKSFNQTIAFLKENELIPYANFFRTRILPGTKLSREKDKYGIKCQDEPPYFVFSTNTLSQEESRECFKPYDEDENMFDLQMPMTAHLTTDYPYADNSIPVPYPDIENLPYPLTKIIIELNSDRQDCHSLKLLGEKLSPQLGNPLTVWFVSENIQQDLRLSASFLQAVSLANPHLSWNIFLETGNEFNLSALAEIKESILNSHHFLVTPIRIFAVFPFRRHKLSGGWVDEFSKTVSFYWYVEFNQGNNWRKEVEDALKNEHELFLVDFAPDSSLDFIVDVLKILRDSKRSRHFLFKNYAIPRLREKDGHSPQNRMTITKDISECILRFNKGLQLISCVLPD
ncbi:MAG: radical SAM protein, partial [Candidatus Omnitrophota bacterium]